MERHEDQPQCCLQREEPVGSCDSCRCPPNGDDSACWPSNSSAGNDFGMNVAELADRDGASDAFSKDSEIPSEARFGQLGAKDAASLAGEDR